MIFQVALGQNKVDVDVDARKVKSQDSIIQNLYQVISGAKGEKRDWELFRFLFLPEARLIPTGRKAEGGFGSRFLSVDEYIETSGAWLEENGFFEKEISRRIETYGSVSHVFSTYESFRNPDDTEPFMRGINSIQLFFDGERWWIVNIFWMPESEEFPIPKQYDQKQ
ncbi:hypothetical protein BST85_11345 [Aureitalea marina]|uniref:DUF4440 domain-containing protein n=2 Tax=Aureitalea marina TaxID=930804 RepID=A0A2S7KTU0_9FLAO|nr:hypothetical protein BST85_11345 [Aureitalea marina]